MPVLRLGGFLMTVWSFIIVVFFFHSLTSYVATTTQSVQNEADARAHTPWHLLGASRISASICGVAEVVVKSEPGAVSFGATAGFLLEIYLGLEGRQSGTFGLPT
ncbi:hypothetical protein V8C37DRAFT_368118 [Trichoderma ceciliae]